MPKRDQVGNHNQEKWYQVGKKDVFVRSVITEFFATAIYVWIGPGVAVTAMIGLGDGLMPLRVLMACLAFGLTGAFLIYATMHLSGGGLFNPAITIGGMLTRQIKFIKGLCYIAAQIVGAIVGAALIKACVPDNWQDGLGTPQLHPDMSVGQGFITELLMAFILQWVVQATALDKGADNPRGRKSFVAPLAIGFAIFGVMMFGFVLTGGSFNPARAIGPAIVNDTWDGYHWIYWVGPIVGAGFAAVLYQLIYEGPSAWRNRPTTDDRPKEVQQDEAHADAGKHVEMDTPRTGTRLP